MNEIPSVELHILINIDVFNGYKISKKVGAADIHYTSTDYNIPYEY